MKDFELENIAIDDFDRAITYIGTIAREKNIYQGNKKPRKQKTIMAPLFAQKTIENV
jgi:hypothetical protein